MPDPRTTRLAGLIADYCVGLKEGDQVFIQAQPEATPLIHELYKAGIARGAHIFPVIDIPGLRAIFLANGTDAQLQYVSPVSKLLVETFDVRISIYCQSNTRELSQIDPARQAMVSAANRPIMQTFMERSAAESLRWNVTLFPTNAHAQDAEMSLADYEDFVYAACLVDEGDPVARWKEVKEKQQQLIDWLAGKSEIHLVGPDTDLTVGIAGRSWVNCFGDRNMPDGEFFTGPEEERVNGKVRFTFPAVSNGREVEDVRLWFEDGQIVKWKAAKNEEFLTQMLNTDEGARRLGEFAFGCNYGIQRFTKNILFDEKIGGTVHMAVGAGYPETGSQNRSAIHWDMICDLRQDGEVRVDGELFAKDGKYIPWE
jgi:aminopeptidase